MQRNSAVIIGLSVVLGFLLFGLLLRPGSTGSAAWHGGLGIGGVGDGDVGRYQFLRANDVTLAVLDTKTGRVWMKFVGSSTGPTEWSEDGPNVAPPAPQQVGGQQGQQGQQTPQQTPTPPRK